MDTFFLSVHTEDRDVSKWPNNNHFSVMLPVEYKNVAAIKLEQIQLPSTQYAFMNDYGNTTFLITLGTTTYTITIAEGMYYNPADLATELSHRIFSTTGMAVLVSYNPIHYKYSFSYTDAFQLSFETTNINHSFWGLGSYLGFQKKVYTSNATNTNNIPLGTSTTGHQLVSEFQSCIHGYSHVYMELDQYNTMDEIEPYTYKSNLLVHSRHSGKHNSCFAKINTLQSNLNKTPSEDWYRAFFVNNPFKSDPPIERIQKLIFKFRYHDGRLVDFGNVDFNFTLSFQFVHEHAKR